MTKTSSLKGFYKLSPEERLKIIADFSDLTNEEVRLLQNTGSLPEAVANNMIENVFGVMPLPMGVAVNFKINEKEYLIPMAVEEASVVAAASNAAKMARIKGGFFSSNTGPVMRAQIQLVEVDNPHSARLKLFEARDEIIKIANDKDPILVSLGGGMIDLEVHLVPSPAGTMVVAHLIVDTRDAMGANAVNTMAEATAPYMEKLTGGKVYLRILSNLADKRLARVRTEIDKKALGGEEIVDGIVWAYTFAEADPYRAATHNKGIMNGIIPVVIATGNDSRAIESGAHAYAARNGHYGSLTHWGKNQEGNLIGSIEVPMAVGLVGGATKVHPIAKIAVKILGVNSAVELGEVIAAAGLAQNLTALKALATEGIQRGHMSLHARNLALTAGATPQIIEKVVGEMILSKKIRQDFAVKLVKKLLK